jgi:hypothetical protein
VNRSDYAANGGTQQIYWHNGPLPSDAYAGNGFLPLEVTSLIDGIGYQRSQVSAADVTDGASCTYMLGEKYHDPNNYTTGLDAGDDSCIFAADDFDRFCWAFADIKTPKPCTNPPMKDRRGFTDYQRWGSAHNDIFNVAMCDGSIHPISYTIDPNVHRDLASRNDSRAVVVPF